MSLDAPQRPVFPEARPASDSMYATLPVEAEESPLVAPSSLSVGQSVSSTPQGTAFKSGLSTPLLPGSEGFATKEELASPGPISQTKPWYKKPWVWLLAVVAIAGIVAAIVVPVVLTTTKKSSDGSSGSSTGTGTGTGAHPTSTPGSHLATWGGDGSTVTKEDGSTFVYKNSFGGFWVSNPANPFNNSAKPNSWTPALNEPWKWGTNRAFGVNIGGLFVLEPFISPALFQNYPGATDEWTLSAIIRESYANGTSQQNLTQVLEQHYDTFITEEDIAQIAGAGLNWIRLPIPFWAIETWSDAGQQTPGGPAVEEPFLARVCWKYILRILSWARKYGIRVNLDLHTAPGSQNGWNHSGRAGTINFLNGTMGIANAQRTLDYIRAIAEFISQPEYVDLIPLFGILNEPHGGMIEQNPLRSFYLRAYNTIRDITGMGEGKGAFISFHDGFLDLTGWPEFLPGADRIAIDHHPYIGFNGQPNTEPIDVPAVGGNGTQMGGQWPRQVCNWVGGFEDSRRQFGVTLGGEFSNAWTDCGFFVNGVNGSPKFGGDCSMYENFAGFSENLKKGVMSYAMASMDALGDWFFWTWKIGNTTSGDVRAPLWSYKLGLENGWMPTDPRQAVGMCSQLGALYSSFDGNYQPWMTGGSGAGTIPPTATVSFADFPPTSVAGVPAGQVPLMPTYTSTRSPITLPPATYTASVIASVGNGWANAADTALMVTAIAGCAYPNAWDATAAPTGGCAAAGTVPATVTAAVSPTTAPPARR